MKTTTFDLVPVKRESLSAAEFIQLSKERPLAIARSRFVYPRLGRRGGFGHFEVEYVTPLLKHHQAVRAE